MTITVRIPQSLLNKVTQNLSVVYPQHNHPAMMPVVAALQVLVDSTKTVTVEDGTQWRAVAVTGEPNNAGHKVVAQPIKSGVNRIEREARTALCYVGMVSKPSVQKRIITVELDEESFLIETCFGVKPLVDQGYQTVHIERYVPPNV